MFDVFTGKWEIYNVPISLLTFDLNNDILKRVEKPTDNYGILQEQTYYIHSNEMKKDFLIYLIELIALYENINLLGNVNDLKKINFAIVKLFNEFQHFSELQLAINKEKGDTTLYSFVKNDNEVFQFNEETYESEDNMRSVVETIFEPFKKFGNYFSFGTEDFIKTINKTLDKTKNTFMIKNDFCIFIKERTQNILKKNDIKIGKKMDKIYTESYNKIIFELLNETIDDAEKMLNDILKDDGKIIKT